MSAFDSLESEPGNGKVDLKKSRRKKQTVVNPMKIDRIPPHSIEDEQGSLGCMLLSPTECIPEAIEFFSGIPNIASVFYDLRHQALWDGLIALTDKRIPIDLVTLQGYLKSHNQLEGVGGLAYLATLPDAVPSAANHLYYLQNLKEKFILREMIQTCTEIVGRAFEHEHEVNELVGEAEANMTRVGDMLVSSKEKTIKDHVYEAIREMERDIDAKGEPTGICYGFPRMDKLTTGGQPGEVTIIAARTSVGKTALALNIADNAAVHNGIPTAIFELEMTGAKLAKRMIAARARVNVRKMSDGYISERQFPKLTVAAGKISQAPIYVCEKSGISILEFKAKARRYAKRGVKLIIVDYLQLMTSNSLRARNNRQQEISDISNGIKQIALELGIHIIVLAQLNRDIEKQKGRKPMLSDLRESGSIEQDADTVLLLYRILNENDEDGPAMGLDAEPYPVGAIIAKQRNGPLDEVTLTYIPQETRFEEENPISSDDVPLEHVKGAEVNYPVTPEQRRSEAAAKQPQPDVVIKPPEQGNFLEAPPEEKE